MVSRLPAWSKIGLCIGIWWTCAVAITLGVKSILGSAQEGVSSVYPFPFMVTALLNGSTAILSGATELARQACMWYGATARVKSFATWRLNDLLQLAIVGLIQGVEIGCFNKALEYLTVAKRTMIMSTSLFFLMVIATIFGLEQMSCGKIVAVALLMSGGCVQGISSWSHRVDDATDQVLSIYGYTMAIFGMLLSSTRWAFMQHLLQRARPDSCLKQMTKMQMLCYMMPVTATACGFLTALWEPEAFAQLNATVLHRVVAISSLLTIMVASELLLVQLTSAVAFSVAAQLHNIPIMVGGVIFFKETVHPLAVAGFSLCIVGALVYTSERRAAAQNHGAAIPQDEADSSFVGGATPARGAPEATGEGHPAPSRPAVLVADAPSHGKDIELPPVLYGAPKASDA